MKNRIKKRFWAVLCVAAIMAGMGYPVSVYAQERVDAKEVLIPSEGTETRVNFVPSSSGIYTFRICVTERPLSPHRR